VRLVLRRVRHHRVRRLAHRLHLHRAFRVRLLLARLFQVHPIVRRYPPVRRFLARQVFQVAANHQRVSRVFRLARRAVHPLRVHTTHCQVLRLASPKALHLVFQVRPNHLFHQALPHLVHRVYPVNLVYPVNRARVRICRVLRVTAIHLWIHLAVLHSVILSLVHFHILRFCIHLQKVPTRASQLQQAI